MIADLWARVGARVDARSWAQADAHIRSHAGRLRGLTGALARFNGAGRDSAGTWRTMSGRMLTIGERAQLAAAGIRGIADASGKARQRTDGLFAALGGMRGMVAGVVAGAAVQKGWRSLIKFNATAEETKVQLAGMMAIAKKTDLSAEIDTANKLYESLQRRAASLPGTTAEYVQMAGKIARVITDAGGSVQDLEDLTVNAVVAGKGLGEQWEVVARDIEQALMGRYSTTDPFLSKVLPSIGYKGEEGRDQWRALSAQKRFTELRRALLQKQFTQLGEAQGKTFAGRLSQLQDQIAITLGAIGKPMFEALSGALEQVNQWIERNRENIKAFGEAVGQVVMGAIGFLGEAVDFLRGFSDEAGIIVTVFGAVFEAVRAVFEYIGQNEALRKVIFGILVAPFVGVLVVIRAVIAAVRGIGAAFRWLGSGIGSVWDAFMAFGSRVRRFFTDDIPSAIKSAFTAAFDFIRNLPVIRQIVDAIQWVREKRGTAEEGARAIAESQQRTQDALRWASPSAALMFASGTPAIPGAPATARGVTVGSVDVGGITVTSRNTDPQAVASEVRRAFSEQMGDMLRITADQVG